MPVIINEVEVDVAREALPGPSTPAAEPAPPADLAAAARSWHHAAAVRADRLRAD